MPEKKNPNIDTYKVLTGDWYSVVQVENDIFDDGYIEACTRAVEIRVKQILTAKGARNGLEEGQKDHRPDATKTTTTTEDQSHAGNGGNRKRNSQDRQSGRD